MKKIKISLDNAKNKLLQNYVMRNNRITKIGGTNHYNTTALSQKILWTDRYYGIKADGTFVKKTFAYSNGKVYLGNDVAGTLTQVKGGLQVNCQVESVTMQVAGNSRMYLFNGYDLPIYYEGDDSGTWYNSSITYKFVQGVIKDDKLWAFEKNSSTLLASRTLYPEDFSSTYLVQIIIGNEKNSFIRRIELLGDDLYIFKNDGIWVLRGSTKATYSVDRVIPSMGLLAQKACCFVGSALVMVCQQDKEIYEFNGTANMRMLSKRISAVSGIDESFYEKLDLNKTDDIVCCWDTINKLFRLSYKNYSAKETYNNHEVIFPTDEIGPNGQPKWSESYGAKISCYSVWNRQGDHTLVTGRIDTGLLEYHDRGHDWDGVAMETIALTEDVTPDEGNNCDFDSLYIKGTPSSGTITFKTWLNNRYSLYNSSQTVSDLGEVRTVGAINFSTQYSFNNWIPLLIGYNHGESLSAEIYDNTLSKDISIETLILDVTPRERILTNLVG